MVRFLSKNVQRVQFQAGRRWWKSVPSWGMFWWGLMLAGRPWRQSCREGGMKRDEGPTGERDSALTICQPPDAASTHLHKQP